MGSNIAEMKGSQQAHESSFKFENIIFGRLLSKEIFAKKFKLFGLPTTKWWVSKMFAKLNENHLLMANIFQTSPISDIWFNENA